MDSLAVFDCHTSQNEASTDHHQQQQEQQELHQEQHQEQEENRESLLVVASNSNTSDPNTAQQHQEQQQQQRASKRNRTKNKNYYYESDDNEKSVVVKQQRKPRSANSQPKKTILSYLTESENLRKQQLVELNNHLNLNLIQLQSSNNSNNNSPPCLTVDLTNFLAQQQQAPAKSSSGLDESIDLVVKGLASTTNEQSSLKQLVGNKSQLKRTRKRRTKKALLNKTSTTSTPPLTAQKSRARGGNKHLANRLNSLSTTTNKEQLKQELLKLFDEQKQQKILFTSPNSIFSKLNFKALFQPSVFESLPYQSQLELIDLLPECDKEISNCNKLDESSPSSTNANFIK